MGVFVELDKFKLSNLFNMWLDIEEWVEKYDLGNVYLINYMWGMMGLGYNVEKVKVVLGDDVLVDSWELLFKIENLEKLKDCGVFMLDVLIEMILVVLNYFGIEFDSKDMGDIEKVGEFLKIICFYI